MTDITKNPVVLSAQGLIKRFGGITATNNVTLNLHQGARHALIGPNGAGKTTLINLLTGVLPPTEGRIVLEGEDIDELIEALIAEDQAERLSALEQEFQ